MRDDRLDLLPQQFVAAVPELPLRLKVQQNNVAVPVHHDHCVRRRFQQPAIAALHLREMLFRRFAHADIADRRHHQDAFGAVQRAQHQFDRELAAVTPTAGQLDTCTNLLGEGFRRAARFVGDQPFREAFGNDVRYLLAQKLIAAIAETAFRLEIQKDNVARLVHDHHSVGRGFQKSAITAFNLGKMLFGAFHNTDCTAL